jgi:hypothetical protein
MRELSRSKAREKAKEAAEPINTLVHPADIDDTAESWTEVDEETLEEELAYSAEIIMSEQQRPFHGIAHDLAMTLWTKDMSRISMEHLEYEDMETAIIKANVWPNQMDKWEIREILEDNYPHNDDMNLIYQHCYNDAYDEVFAGIIDGMQPTDE